MKGKKIARTAIIASCYVVLTLIAAPISFGPVQLRISESMALLPILFPEAILGLTIGCMLANIYSGGWDILFGSLFTLIACILTRLLKKYPPLAAIPPIVINALGLPLMWMLMGSEESYWMVVLSIFVSQFIVAGLLGLLVHYTIKNVMKRSGKLY